MTFDILESVARSGTQHDHDQPSHLKIKPNLEKANKDSRKRLDGIEQRFCPAKVYEFVENEEGEKELVINAQNCIHCKTCDIKVFLMEDGQTVYSLERASRRRRT